MVERIRAQNSSPGVSVSRVWVRVPVVTLVSLSKTLHYSCFSPPGGKLVPVRSEMVLVIDLVIVAQIYCTGCILLRELR